MTTLPSFVAIGHMVVAWNFLGSSDAAAKIVSVTSQEHVIKEPGDFMEENSSLYIPTLPKLRVIDIILMDI